MDCRIYAASGAAKEQMRRDAQSKMELGMLDKPDLFLLPEAFLVKRWKDADYIEEPGNEIYQWLSETACLYNAYIVASLIIRENGLVYNAAVVFDRQGQVPFVYHKTHLPPEEIEAGFTPGTGTPGCFDADFRIPDIGAPLSDDMRKKHVRFCPEKPVTPFCKIVVLSVAV